MIWRMGVSTAPWLTQFNDFNNILQPRLLSPDGGGSCSRAIYTLLVYSPANLTKVMNGYRLDTFDKVITIRIFVAGH